MPAEMNLDAILSLFLEVDVERAVSRFGQLEALRREDSSFVGMTI
jgi:hypothetical protein